MDLRTGVAIRHVEFEDLGLLTEVLEAHHFTHYYLDAPVNDGGWDGARDADLLIVLGGPVGVEDAETFPFLAAELDVLRSRVAQNLPTLGICLGAQLLATACGGSVSAGETAEVGYAPLGLTEAGADSVLAPLHGLPVLHWHQDVITTPAGTPSLAYTAACATQAFARGSNLLGLQFHLEADRRSLERWLVAYSYELAVRGIDVETLRRAGALDESDRSARARTVFSNWLSGLAF